MARPGFENQAEKRAVRQQHTIACKAHDVQLQHLTSLLYPTMPLRLLTLVGRDGVGKTSLAFEAFRRLEPVYCGAVGRVCLTDVATSAQLPIAILESLPQLERSIAESAHRPHQSIWPASAAPIPDPANDDGSLELLDRLAQAFAMRPFLLLLDHFEHLLADSLPSGAATSAMTLDGAGMVATLLARTPGLKCLITSRRLLDLDGECQLPLFAPHTPLDATPRSLYTPLHG